MLNIQNMISIEKDEHNQERFEFNKPFSCIDMKFGESVDILPSLQWNLRSIVWLDYDGKLTDGVLADLHFVLSNCSSGTTVLVSVNAEPYNQPPDKQDFAELGQFRLNNLEEAVGKGNVPAGIKPTDLNRKNFGSTCRRIIHDHIKKTLVARNGGSEVGSKMMYRQLYNFAYADGAKMLTVGGVLFDEGQEGHFNQCGFDALSFYMPDDDQYVIDVPNLTYKEIRCLDSQLPSDEMDGLFLPNVSEDDLKKYRKLYRYFPTFSESSLG